MGETIGHPIRLQVGDIETREIDAPFLEVSADYFAAAVLGEGGYARGDEHCAQYEGKEETSGGSETRRRHNGPPDPNSGAGGV